MDPITRSRELAARYFDGRLSAPEMDELQLLLRTHPEAADAFARSSRLESGLRDLFAQEQDVRHETRVVETIARRHRRHRALVYAGRLAVAACVLFVVLGALMAWLSWPATVNQPPRRGTEVLAGTFEQQDGLSRVTSAEATLRLSDGSRVRLERGSEVVMPSDDFGRLVEMHSGVGHFAVSESDADFRVETPAGRVTALGTEFSVTLTHYESEDESMKLSHVVLAVVVASGLVQVEAGGELGFLGAGDSRIFAQERQRDEAQKDRRKEDRKPAANSFRGTVESVGDKTLTLAAGRGEATTIDVPETAKVSVDGKQAKLSDLAKGMVVVIEKASERGAVTAIRAEGATIAAVIKSIDADKVVVRGQRRNDEGKEYAIARGAKVTINGQPGKVGDLKADDRVGLGLSVDGKVVNAIVRESRIFGGVKGIDVKARTIAMPGGRDGDRKYEISRDVKVTAGEKAAKLEDVKEGTSVALTLDQEGKVVTAIAIGGGRGGDVGRREAEQGTRFGGEVSSIDPKTNKISIKAERGEREFTVADNARVMVDGKAGKLGDVKKGDRVTVLLDKDGKTVQALVKGGRDGEGVRRGIIAGVVKGTEKDKITVLVGDKQDEKAFTLAKEVKITIDGKEGKLEDVKEKARVRLTLGKDEKSVVEIAVGRGRGEEARPERGLQIRGKIKSADAKANKIAIQAGRENAEARELVVAKDAKVTIDGKAAKLEDVKEGTEAILTLSEDRKTVKEIVIAPARKRE